MLDHVVNYNRTRALGPDLVAADAWWTESDGKKVFTYSVPYIKSAQVKKFCDNYHPYGKGVWPYRPCFSYKGNFRFNPVPLSLERPSSCRHMCNGRWWNGVYAMSVGDFPSDMIQATAFGGSKSCLSQSLSKVQDFMDQVVPGDLWSTLERRLTSKLPTLSSGPDYFVSIKELKDILFTFDFLKAKNIISKVAEGLLSVTYGIKPLISDLIGLIDTFTKLAYEITALHEGAGKIHDLSTSVYQVLDSSTVTKNYCPWAASCGRHTFKKVYQYKARLGATIKYRYHFPEYMLDAFNDIMPYVKASGLFPSLVSVWDMIPFSFVIDWVLNTEHLFNKWKGFVDPHDIQVDILDLCVTEKLTGENAIYFDGSCFQTQGPFYEEEYILFERTVGTFALETRVPLVTLPTSMQMILGSALTWANLPPIKRKAL